MERAFELEVKTVAEQEGTFEGVASTYGGEPDAYGDVVDVGAFQRTLSAGKEIPLLWMHKDPIGVVELKDTAHGLLAKGKLTLSVQQAREALALMRDNAVRGLSIGYQTIKSKYVEGVRHLQEVRLWEVSLTPVPANSNAVVTAVKSADLSRINSIIESYRSEIKSWKLQS